MTVEEAEQIAMMLGESFGQDAINATIDAIQTAPLGRPWASGPTYIDSFSDPDRERILLAYRKSLLGTIEHSVQREWRRIGGPFR